MKAISSRPPVPTTLLSIPKREWESRLRMEEPSKWFSSSNGSYVRVPGGRWKGPRLLNFYSRQAWHRRFMCTVFGAPTTRWGRYRDYPRVTDPREPWEVGASFRATCREVVNQESNHICQTPGLSTTSGCLCRLWPLKAIMKLIILERKADNKNLANIKGVFSSRSARSPCHLWAIFFTLLRNK